MDEPDPIDHIAFIRTATVKPLRAVTSSLSDNAGTTLPMPPASAASPAVSLQVTFDRHELNQLLNLYGRRVAAGEWRDYAIDFHKDRAIFSVFRRTSESPLYRIEKQPRLARRQGAWSVVSAAGIILKRGNDLTRVLAAIDKPLRIVRD